MDNLIVYFDSSPELKSLLQQRGISLEGIASQVNIEAEVTFGSPTILNEESHYNPLKNTSHLCKYCIES